MVRFIDLFCWIWWFRLALSRLWMECVFSSDIDENCRKTYFENYWEVPEWDITKIAPENIPDHEILCAWFPCQPFSVSWKQLWFNDTRWTLFFNILNILKEKKPKVVFLENVSNLRTHDKWRTLQVIISSLNELWYKTSYKVLNAKDFWVPQNRERIIIVASLDKEFDFSLVHKNDTTTIRDILDKEWDFEYLKPEDYTIIDKKYRKRQPSWLIFCWYRNKTIRKNWARPNTEHLSRVHKQPNRIYHINWVHPTIPSQEVSGRFRIYNDKNVRKLTIDECFKLQWFPKSFKKIWSKWTLYKQIGNSVPVPLIEAVANEIKNQFFN